MNMNNYKIVISAVLIIFISGCKDWLSLKPQDGLTSDSYWQTKEQVKAAVTGCYSSMMDNPSTTDNNRTAVELFFLWGELRADMLSPNSNATNEEKATMNSIISPNYSLCNWRPIYRTINYCNTLIQLAPNVLKTDETFTQEALNGYLAEALAIRGLMYFYLVRTFGEVPLKLDATLSDEVVLTRPKNTSAEVLHQIVADLNAAEQMATISYGTIMENKGRLTKYGVNAIQADVYLWKEQYDSCIIACDKVISSGQFGLVDHYADLFMVGKTSESIFELEFDPQVLNPFYNLFGTDVGRKFLSSQRVVDEVYMIDLDDPSEIYDHRGNNVSLKYSNLSVWKYLGLNSSTGRTVAQSYAPWIFYRYADILLMKAEACAQINRGSESLDMIAQIRERAQAISLTEQIISPDDVSGLTDYILAERAREFSFEGKRWFDVLRNAKRNHYERKSLLVNLITSIAPETLQTTMVNNIQDTLSHYLPIFTYELQTDKALIQNNFYK
jgi:starch-binding outer membrane protein, SusD/RagB family